MPFVGPPKRPGITRNDAPMRLEMARSPATAVVQIGARVCDMSTWLLDVRSELTRPEIGQTASCRSVAMLGAVQSTTRRRIALTWPRCTFESTR